MLNSGFFSRGHQAEYPAQHSSNDIVPFRRQWQTPWEQMNQLVSRETWVNSMCQYKDHHRDVSFCLGGLYYFKAFEVVGIIHSHYKKHSALLSLWLAANFVSSLYSLNAQSHILNKHPRLSDPFNVNHKISDQE